jgi:hypothetical protein
MLQEACPVEPAPIALRDDGRRKQALPPPAAAKTFSSG